MRCCHMVCGVVVIALEGGPYGHMVCCVVMVCVIIALEGGPYMHKYRAAQFHFHWGKTSHEGAEHLVDGKAHAAEVSSD